MRGTYLHLYSIINGTLYFCYTIPILMPVQRRRWPKNNNDAIYNIYMDKYIHRRPRQFERVYSPALSSLVHNIITTTFLILILLHLKYLTQFPSNRQPFFLIDSNAVDFLEISCSFFFSAICECNLKKKLKKYLPYYLRFAYSAVSVCLDYICSLSWAARCIFVYPVLII